MDRERLFRPVREFASRPFDRAASRLAYEAATILPLLFTFYHSMVTVPMIIVEFRPPQHLAVAAVEVGLTWVMARKIRERVINEASAHNFRLTKLDNNRAGNGPKPPSSGGGAF